MTLLPQTFRGKSRETENEEAAIVDTQAEEAVHLPDEHHPLLLAEQVSVLPPQLPALPPLQSPERGVSLAERGIVDARLKPSFPLLLLLLLMKLDIHLPMHLHQDFLPSLLIKVAIHLHEDFLPFLQLFIKVDIVGEEKCNSQ